MEKKQEPKTHCIVKCIVKCKTHCKMHCIEYLSVIIGRDYFQRRKKTAFAMFGGHVEGYCRPVQDAKTGFPGEDCKIAVSYFRFLLQLLTSSSKSLFLGTMLMQLVCIG